MGPRRQHDRVRLSWVKQTEPTINYTTYSRQWAGRVHCARQCRSRRWRRRSGMTRRPTSGSPTIYTGHCRPGSADWCWPGSGRSGSSKTWWSGDWTRHSAVEGLLPRRRLGWPAPGQSRSCLDCCSFAATLYNAHKIHIAHIHAKNDYNTAIAKLPVYKKAYFWKLLRLQNKIASHCNRILIIISSAKKIMLYPRHLLLSEISWNVENFG